ncbi:MAG: hypothetical protein ACJ8DI_14890, partial [Ktedonobacteraceae bacterium]
MKLPSHCAPHSFGRTGRRIVTSLVMAATATVLGLAPAFAQSPLQPTRSHGQWHQSSSKRPLGGLLFSNVFHSLAVASRTSNRRHASPILPTEFRRPNGHVNDGFIDQHLFTA